MSNSKFNTETKNHVEIHYCTQCKWLLRASWMGQELLSSFEEIEALTLIPSSGGRFKIFANQTEIWDRKRDSSFPEITQLKVLVRYVIAPTKDLGHIDRKHKQ